MHVHATIFCKEGFILEGKDILTCTESGKWDGEVPICIGELTFLSKSRGYVYHTDLGTRLYQLWPSTISPTW